MRSAKPSFAGTGLLERMRSTTFALFGITAAMALGLVALALQQDWSVLPAAPIPAVPKSNQVGDARVVAEQPTAPPVSADTSGPPRGEVAAGGNARAPKPRSAELSGPRQVAAAAPPPAAGPAVGGPAGQTASPASPDPGPPPTAAPAPTSEPTPTPTPAPAAPPASSPPGSGAVAVGGSQDKGRTATEADVDNAEGGDSDDRGKPPGKYRPPRGGWKGSKPPKAEDADSVAAAPTAPPATEPEESADEDEYKTPDGDGYEYDGADSSDHRGNGRGHGRWGYGR